MQSPHQGRNHQCKQAERHGQYGNADAGADKGAGVCFQFRPLLSLPAPCAYQIRQRTDQRRQSEYHNKQQTAGGQSQRYREKPVSHHQFLNRIKIYGKIHNTLSSAKVVTESPTGFAPCGLSPFQTAFGLRAETARLAPHTLPKRQRPSENQILMQAKSATLRGRVSAPPANEV